MISKISYSFTLLKQSWLESLKALAPSRLLVSAFLLRTTLMHMLTAWRTAPWVLVSVLLCVLIAAYTRNISALSILYYSVWALVTLLITSATRASVVYKNNRYFIYTLAHASIIIPVLVLIFMLVLPVINNSVHATLFVSRFISSFLISWVVFAVLFWLDAQTTAQDYLVSGVRAGILVIYNYPFCFGAYLMLSLLIGLVNLISAFLGLDADAIPLLRVIIRMAGLMGSYIVYIAMLTNFYIKRVHDQFTLYYQL